MLNLTNEEIISKITRSQVSINLPKKQYEFLPGEPKPAAVLVPLLQQGNPKEWHLLFTRRTDTVADHKGQVSFPGGREEPGDTSPIDTALREAREEIGLDSSSVKILGTLPGCHTITNYWVVPVVGFIRWPFQAHLHLEEVSRIFTIPLGWLQRKENHELRDRIIFLPDGQQKKIDVIFFKPYEDELLWGVSAEITLSLLNVLG